MMRISSLVVFSSAVCGSLIAQEPLSNNQPMQTEQSNVLATAPQQPKAAPQVTEKAIAHFTGKVTKSRVRLRFSPNLESPVLKELTQDDLIVVTAVNDEFYAVLPPPQMKGYVFRTYVLDGVVEGSHVNVRLEPDVSAPVVCQLNSGERISGKIAAQNSKWLEIALPESVRFYVAKEFISRAGDEKFFTNMERRKSQLDEKLASIDVDAQNELKKPFREIELAPIALELNQIIAQNKDLPKVVERAEGLLQKMQKAYLEKSIANKAPQKPSNQELSNQNPAKTKKAISKTQDESSVAIQQPSENSDEAQDDDDETNSDLPSKVSITSLMLPYNEREKQLLQQALESKTAASETDFYTQEEKRAATLSGIVKPYSRPVKNLPGDYILINPKTGLTIAFIYSTKVDLNKLLNSQVTVVAAERPNNNFAYPAYFVLKTQ